MGKQLAVGSRQWAVVVAVAAATVGLGNVDSLAVAGQDGIALRGRLLLVGPVPPVTPLPPGRDVCCQTAKPIDESVVVGPKGGLANVVVSVETRRGEPKPPPTAPPTEPAVLTNRGCAFLPRVLVARVGQPLELQNDDPTMHNVNIGFVRNGAVNVVVEPDGVRNLAIAKPERRPVAVRCNVHTFMQAWIIARDDGYATVTDESGRFELPPLPPGEWRLRFWREGQPIEGLAVAEGETDARGDVRVTVESGEDADLGDLRVRSETLR